MTTILLLCGKVNFTNLSRDSPLNEKTDRRFFAQAFNFCRFNQLLAEQSIPAEHGLLAVMDASFMIITKESLTFMIGKRPAIIDLAAEKLLVAEKDTQKIAVEVKSFLGPSPMSELEKALGQFFLYLDVLAENDPDRILYLAISQSIYEGFFAEEIGQLLSRRRPELKLIVFDPNIQEIVQWKPSL